MNEDFAPFELAVKLNEKGFNEPCYGYYHCNGGNDSFELCGNGDRDFLNSKNQYRVAAPTISQVLKWLREEKDIHIVIDIWGRTWGYDVLDLPSGNSLHWDAYNENINSYEQAVLAGIEYVIDNLI